MAALGAIYLVFRRRFPPEPVSLSDRLWRLILGLAAMPLCTLAAVVLLCFIANEAIDHRSATYKVCQHVLMALVAISLFYSMLMCFVPETGWLSEAYPWAYQNLVEMVVFWS